MNFCPVTYLFDRDRWYSSYILRISDMRHKRMFTAIDKLTHSMMQFIDSYRHVDFMAEGTHVVADDYLTCVPWEQNINYDYFDNILTTNPIIIDDQAHTDFIDATANSSTSIPVTYLGSNVGLVTSTAFSQNVNYNGNNANKWHMSCAASLDQLMINIIAQKQNEGYIVSVTPVIDYTEHLIQYGKFIFNYRKTNQITQFQITFIAP